jgi:hypothetical protein
MSHLYDQSPLGKGFSGDLFGRLKVSNPYTLFDSTHRYSQDGDYNDVIVGSGSTSGIITSQSTATLTIGSTSGCSYIRESKRVFKYQPGKSLQCLQSFVFNEPKANLVQRVGYASSENGLLLEKDGFNVNYVLRTTRSGVSTSIVVPQSNWNLDTLDGNGPSGYTLNLNNIQIMFSELEWLGGGALRSGFIIDGKFIVAHQFNHANHLDGVYMTTASLPIRYEIFNNGNVGSASTLKQVCVTVQSNGGYERKVAPDVVTRPAPLTGIGLTFVPIVSYSLSPGREDAIILPHDYQVLPLSNNINYEIALIKNTTLVGAAFSASASPNAHFDRSATALSGGLIFHRQYITGSNQAGGAISVESEYNWDLQLGRTQDKVSDTLTLAIRTLSGTGDAIGSLAFYDLT